MRNVLFIDKNRRDQIKRSHFYSAMMQDVDFVFVYDEDYDVYECKKDRSGKFGVGSVFGKQTVMRLIKNYENGE